MVVSGVSIKRVGGADRASGPHDLPPCRLGVPVVSVSLPIRRAVESLEQGAEGVFIQGRELGFRAGQVLLPGGGVPDFRAGSGPDDHELVAKPGVLPKNRRDGDAPLFIG